MEQLRQILKSAISTKNDNRAAYEIRGCMLGGFGA